MKRKYDIKQIYNIYVAIAQAHFIYQPHIPKTIKEMPSDWLEVENLLEDYLEEQGADFEQLRKEWTSVDERSYK